MPHIQRTQLPNGAVRFEPVRTNFDSGFARKLLIVYGFVLLAGLWQLFQTFTAELLWSLVMWSGSVLLVRAIGLNDSLHPTAVTVHEGKLGVACLTGDQMQWVSQTSTNEIVELVSVLDRSTTWHVRWNPTAPVKSATLCVVSGDRTRRPMELSSGPPAYVAELGRHLLDELNGPGREGPVTYREESGEFTGEPRAHQPAWSRLRATFAGETTTFRLNSGDLCVEPPRVRSSWFNWWKRKTHRLTDVVIRLDPDGISVGDATFTHACKWAELQTCRIETEQVQIPEQGSDTVYRIEFTTTEQGRWSISGMWGRDAEWLLFHIHQRAHFQTANRDNW